VQCEIGNRKTGNAVLILLGVIVAVLVVGGVLYYIFSPRSPTSCIQIPVEISSEESKKAADIAAKAEAAIQGQADVAARYDTVLHQTFAKLSDRNVTLYIFAQAIECYLKHNNQASNDVANRMTELLRAELANSRGGEGLTGPLTAPEESDIKKSPYASTILNTFSRLK
jgi:hypothetical protein